MSAAIDVLRVWLSIVFRMFPKASGEALTGELVWWTYVTRNHNVLLRNPTPTTEKNPMLPSVVFGMTITGLHAADHQRETLVIDPSF